MISSPRPEPQDRLPGEKPAGSAEFEMPVIGPDGVITPARPAPQLGLPVGGVAHERSMNAAFAEIKREGPWTVASRTKASMVFGEITLDLREATLESASVDFNVFTLCGELTVIVPPQVLVTIDGTVIFGDRTVTLRTPVPPGAPRVALHVNGGFCDVVVKEMERGERAPRWYDRFRRPR